MTSYLPTGEEAKLDDASEVEMTTIMETIKEFPVIRVGPSKYIIKQKTEVIFI